MGKVVYVTTVKYIGPSVKDTNWNEYDLKLYERIIISFVKEVSLPH